MTFDIEKFAKIDAGTTNEDMPRNWKYDAGADSIDAVLVVNYFLEVTSFLAPGDGIFVRVGAELNLISVASATSVTVTTAPVILGSGAATVSSANFTTVGGAATEIFSTPGTVIGDVVLTQMKAAGGAPVTILLADVLAADQVSVTFSADPAGDHQLAIAAFR